MPSAMPPNPRAGSDPPDDLDQLLDYDNAETSFLRDIPLDNNAQENGDTTSGQPRDEDQEVQIKKKRRPIPKLDDNLLLTQNGIPKLRKIAKTRLKFRGKGHEFSDISRLLNTYQLWLDDLYPRAKFRDALTMVEKVGHSKRMQVMRKAWLDDTKPHRRDPSPGREMSGANADGMDTNDNLPIQHEGAASRGMSHSSPARMTTEADGAPADDELDALLAESTEPVSAAQRRTGPFFEESDDENELDALMAETEAAAGERARPRDAKPSREGLDEDELNALIAEQSGEHASASTRIAAQEDDFADDEEAMASLGW